MTRIAHAFPAYGTTFARPFTFVPALALALAFAAGAAAQEPETLLPGDELLDPSAIAEHRSGLDIVYLDANTLGSLIRYLTAPTGLTTMYQMGSDIHVTYSGRDGTRQTADTTLASPRFGGASDLVLAALDLSEGESVRIPEISGAANTLAAAMVTNTVTLEGRERLDVSGVWSGPVRRFRETRANGTAVVYWIAGEAPHLIRQDFLDDQGRRFLRWELTEHGAGVGR